MKKTLLLFVITLIHTINANVLVHNPTNIKNSTNASTNYFACGDFTADIVYVNAAATGTNTGTSWANAFTDLQAALTTVKDCATLTTIYVAEGTYYPTSGTDRTIYFDITFNVNIYGGFSPTNGAIDLASRNATTYKTSLSGNIGNTSIATDNSLSILQMSPSVSVSIDVILDGLTITEGYDDNFGSYPGIYIGRRVTSLINNCEITNHFSKLGGFVGAALCIHEAPIGEVITIKNSTFKNNTNGGNGGAISIRTEKTVKIINTVFDGNTASRGAGIYLSGSTMAGIALDITNSVFVNNNNTSSSSEGTIDQSHSALNLNIKNSIFWNNTHNGSTTALQASITRPNNVGTKHTIISNSIVANYGGSGSSHWTTNNFLVDGGNNLDTNPLFTDLANGDFTLQSTSPAIDTGDNTAVTETTDLAGNTRITDGDGDLTSTVDMGAYETPRNPCLDFPNKVYVNALATGLNNGTSWANAYTNLQDALNNPLTCFNNEIWVAKGTYKPHNSDQSVYFSPPKNVSIYGGFNGTETLVSERNWYENPTILSGDLNNSNSANAGDSHTIFYIEKDNVVLDGFIFENSYADGGLLAESDYGAGMYSTATAITVKNCIFRNNIAQGLGSFKGNGGAFFKTGTGSLSIFNSVFHNNSATLRGGAGYSNLGTLTVINCTFAKNSGNNIGAIGAFGATVTVANSIFYNNVGTTQDLIKFGSGGSITVSNNSFSIGITSGITNAGGNFTFMNPSFVDEITNDYRLKISSSVLNAGDDSKNMETKDLLGNPRKTGTIDMGAYEYDATITEWLGNTDSNWNDINNWSDGIPTATKSILFRGGIPNEPNVTVANAVAKDVFLDTGVILTVDANKSLTINRDFTNNGTFTILSNATSSGSFILGGSYSGTSNISYQRYLTTNWHLVSSPVNGQNINTFKDDVARSGNKYAIAPYNNALATNKYEYYTDNTGTNNIDVAGSFTKGKGYSIKKSTAGTLTFSGTLHTDNVPFSITDNSAGVGSKWNLIGNPYTSFLSLNTDADATNNFLTLNAAKLNPTRIAVYLWNALEGKYDVLNHATGSAKYIAPGQAFFVEAANSGATLTIDKILQKHQTGNLFSKNTNTSPTIKLSISNDEKTIATEIKYIENTTAGLDLGYDAGTFSENTNSLAIYTHLVAESNGTDFALQCLPNSDLESMIIPVGITVDANTEITISAASLNLPKTISVYLEDKQTHTFINLNDTSYTVTITENTNGIGRFFLHTASSALSTHNNYASENISIYTTDKNNLRVVGIQNGNAKLTLFNLLGKEILKTNFTAKGVNDIQLPNLKTGVYIVVLNTEKGKKTKKIIIE
ncbi:T9SS type A sorting domain-containing protein [Polaribacter porphyrae]|uniref:Secretion system C-terminal sorting domain-containing protein n=1 Tax=Polaribacter porphyrae TaxID=1137780 RepID=A0A2S7WQ01_9FLAO|nr:T9SS type A sorting domain-containing protein [Polaribacter porphyrae]PQJ79695.1 hypothetical protein BTO18_11155 [Polaribacter porphyrae]